jgi:hypothetical protein
MTATLLVPVRSGAATLLPNAGLGRIVPTLAKGRVLGSPASLALLPTRLHQQAAGSHGGAIGASQVQPAGQIAALEPQPAPTGCRRVRAASSPASLRRTAPGQRLPSCCSSRQTGPIHWTSRCPPAAFSSKGFDRSWVSDEWVLSKARSYPNSTKSCMKVIHRIVGGVSDVDRSSADLHGERPR